MARREIVVLSCDRDNCGEEKDVRTVKFGFEGAWFETDLCTDHHAELAEVFDGIIYAARREMRPGKSSATRSPQTAAEHKRRNEEARAWLQGDGHYPVGKNGRIPAKYLEAYLSRTVNPEWVAQQAAEAEKVKEEAVAVPAPRKAAPAKKVAKKAVAKKAAA